MNKNIRYYSYDYIIGGCNFFFNNERNPKNSIDLTKFVNLIKEKSNYKLLINIYHNLVKTIQNFNMNDYIKDFDNPQLKPQYGETFFKNRMREINNYISKSILTIDEYFSHLIQYNVSTQDVLISRRNFIKYMQREGLKYSTEELDNILIKLIV